MSTFLFDQIIIGPISSRRLGSSLGVNLLPMDQKICNFDCRYCECGGLLPTTPFEFCSLEHTIKMLREKLTSLRDAEDLPDAITFAGNGEPTLHPQFAQIVSQTIDARDELAPMTKICVLTNATNLYKEEVVEVLRRVDLPMLKLDGGNINCIKRLNQPSASFTMENLVTQLKLFGQRLIIQSMFVCGSMDGLPFDNTTDAEISDWLAIIQLTKPQSVVIYTLSRETPTPGLLAVSDQTLNSIKKRVEALNLGIVCDLICN